MSGKPSDSPPHAFTFDGIRNQVIAHGGGAIDENGNGAGSLTTRTVSGSIELAPHTGAVLLDR